MEKINQFTGCYILLILFIITGCAGNLHLFSKKSPKKKSVFVPAGVDSSVATEADSLADQLFVSWKREHRANKFKEHAKKETVASDTLWKYLTRSLGDSFSVSRQDSLKAIEAFNAGARNLQTIAQLEKKSKNELTSQEQLRLKILQLLEAARKNFEKAVILNPFDLETRSWLARVYQALAVRFLDEENHLRAAKVLENLVRLEKGEHTLYARLAESYYALENWPAAHDNFALAEKVYFETLGLDFTHPDTARRAQLDSTTIYYYTYYQADTEVKMHQAEKALTTFARARQWARSDREREDIQSYIDWINWDDGNIEAVELRDKFIALQEAQRYKEAARGFEKLLDKLRTRRARDEIAWRLSLLEFQFLNAKDRGIDRLKEVVLESPRDEHGAPLDSTYQSYFDSYGAMCHNLGLEYFRKNRKVAFTYLKQAVAIAWENRAKSYLELAKLSRNNPRMVIENCELALQTPEQLEQIEQMQAYQLLVEAYKRLGKFNKARAYFARWVTLRKNATRSARR